MIVSFAEGNELPAISETGRLFLRNLPYQATEADLTALFQDYGELSEVHLVVDRSALFHCFFQACLRSDYFQDWVYCTASAEGHPDCTD